MEGSSRLQNNLGLRIAIGTLIVVLGAAAIGTVEMARQLSSLSTQVSELTGRLDRRDARISDRFEQTQNRINRLNRRIRSLEVQNRKHDGG